MECGVSTKLYNGYRYHTVAVGDQCWLVENLRTESFADGSPIPLVQDDSAWVAETLGARTMFVQTLTAVEQIVVDEIYDGDIDLAVEAGLDYTDSLEFVSQYGYLYNWFAVEHPSGLCPTGWHVATWEDYNALANAAGGASVAGSSLKSSESDVPAWDGTNSLGLSGLPGGVRDMEGDYSLADEQGFYWSGGTSDAEGLYSDPTQTVWQLGTSQQPFLYLAASPTVGTSVRCVRDADEPAAP